MTAFRNGPEQILIAGFPSYTRGGGYVGSWVMLGTQIRRGSTVYSSTRYRLEYLESPQRLILIPTLTLYVSSRHYTGTHKTPATSLEPTLPFSNLRNLARDLSSVRGFFSLWFNFAESWISLDATRREQRQLEQRGPVPVC